MSATDGDELGPLLDEQRAYYRTPDELVEGPSSSTIRRQLPDGTGYRLVKVPHQPADLERRLRQLGWHIKVTSTAGPFYWGAGSRGIYPT